MLQIIGYIAFIIITVASCVGAAVVGTMTGIKQNEMEDQNK
jgi:Flp pilus assembly pilin Flp